MYNLQGVELFSPTLSQILISFLVSLVCSFAISIVYRFTYRGPGYSNSFLVSIIVLSLITSLVILVIGNNLARAFGLVGALSIIRFRTAVKDTMDIVFIFFGLAIGMASGVGYFELAVVGTSVISLALIGLTKTNINMFRGEQFLLQLQYSDDDVTSAKNVMDDYCSSYQMINIKSPGGTGAKEFSYYIHLKKQKNYLDFLRDMKSISGVEYINLFRDEEHI
jgi:hypothetical protein